LLEFYAEPNTSRGLASNYLAAPPRRIDKDQFNQRIDFVKSSGSTWFGRFGWADDFELDPSSLSNQVPFLNGTQILTKAKQATIANTQVLRPNLFNEFRFGYNQFFNNLGQELAFRRDVVGELKIPGLPSLPATAWGIPFVRLSAGGFSNFGNGP